MDDHSLQQEQWEEIERFLQGQLTQEQEQSFRDKLATDTNLKNGTEEMRLLILGVQESTLREKLDGFHKQLPVKKSVAEIKPAKIRSMSKWLAAASIIVVLLATYFIIRNTGDNDLYATYFKADPGLISSMGSSADYQFDRGMVDYKTGNYNAAIKLWEPLINQKINSDTLHYFLASAYLASEQTIKSIPLYEKVIADEQSAFRKDAYWYAALAYIKQGNNQKAIPYLQKSEHSQKETLLKKLQD